mmetsp:Transcript_22443/g.49047  ORF Transcript_22443/g.49047 Transcript_22443/m.49047 type:complete len:281 (+) Transcript_22443:163-1005(+)
MQQTPRRFKLALENQAQTTTLDPLPAQQLVLTIPLADAHRQRMHRHAQKPIQLTSTRQYIPLQYSRPTRPLSAHMASPQHPPPICQLSTAHCAAPSCTAAVRCSPADTNSAASASPPSGTARCAGLTSTACRKTQTPKLLWTNCWRLMRGTPVCCPRLQGRCLVWAWSPWAPPGTWRGRQQAAAVPPPPTCAWACSHSQGATCRRRTRGWTCASGSCCRRCSRGSSRGQQAPRSLMSPPLLLLPAWRASWALCTGPRVTVAGGRGTWRLLLRCTGRVYRR